LDEPAMGLMFPIPDAATSADFHICTRASP
jgi:hypothetical protein